jgi:hypothetical protein
MANLGQKARFGALNEIGAIVRLHGGIRLGIGLACACVNIRLFTHGMLLAWRCQKNKLKKYVDRLTGYGIVCPVMFAGGR